MPAKQPKHADHNHVPFKNHQEYYELVVQGHLDELWAQWFEGMTLSHVENGESGAASTMIAGAVADQSALHGLLIKIRNLNLKLISVRRVKPGKKDMEEFPNDD